MGYEVCSFWSSIRSKFIISLLLFLSYQQHEPHRYLGTKTPLSTRTSTPDGPKYSFPRIYCSGSAQTPLLTQNLLKSWFLLRRTTSPVFGTSFSICSFIHLSSFSAERTSRVSRSMIGSSGECVRVSFCRRDGESRGMTLDKKVATRVLKLRGFRT